MTPAARVAAAIALLDEILAGRPAEQTLTGWARRSRFAGSKDRAAIRDHVFDALRCRRSFAALGGAMTGRGLMLGLARAHGLEVDLIFDGSAYGPSKIQPDEGGRQPTSGAEAGDIPDWLWSEFATSLGDRALSGAAYLRQRAPVFLRVNTRKTKRDVLIDTLRDDGIETRSHVLSPTALEVTQGARRLRKSNVFQSGAFEFQDAASQAVVDAVPLSNGMRVLDYCAGGGGKTLALGASSDVALFAHDVDAQRMRDLPDRAQRAGVEVQICQDPAASDPFDVVLCDAPCSGSGAWRRSPAGKWALTPDRLEELTDIQDDILQKAARLVAPGGLLAYATCSVLDRENEARVATFLAGHSDWVCQSTQRWPLAGGGDGFFLARFARG